MSDFGALYDYIINLEEEIPAAAMTKLKEIRPGFLPELKADKEAREKEEREARTKEEREAAARNGRPAATTAPAPRPAA